MENKKINDTFNLNSFEDECISNNHERFSIISKLITEAKPEKILDIGVCTGLIYKKYLINFLKKNSVYGIDIDEKFLKIAEELGINVKSCNLDKEKIPFDDNKFDLVLCDSILEHTLNPKGLLEEISRVINKNGRLIVCVPNAVSMLKRLDSIRGRSQFYPIIDNLFNWSYMKRCAVLYSPSDLKWVMEKYFIVNKTFFWDRKKNDPKTVSFFLCRLLSRIFPTTRDMIIMEAIKK